MVLPAQFQLGLELTNIVNPISQAVSALGSLALVDAIRKSGSDAITETKFASLIGRHRVDPIMKTLFRDAVAKSNQLVISRYLDIILESGAGPTVQESLKNPALFSMVIQLSALAFAHEDEPLANTIVEAVERIVADSKKDPDLVPDYTSLLGTVRACQQQTVAFGWSCFYEAVEAKLRDAVRQPKAKPLKKRRRISTASTNLIPVWQQQRALPFPVFQALLMWLQALQSLPEHRFLHLKCNRGISTVIVWCYHILGLSLTVKLPDRDISFGNAPYNLVVEQSRDHDVSAILMDPASPNEPLFTLTDHDENPGTGSELRAEAYGYGLRVLQRAGIANDKINQIAEEVIAASVRFAERSSTYYVPRGSIDDQSIEGENGKSMELLEPYFPSKDYILQAGAFLFARDALDLAGIHSYALTLDDDKLPLTPSIFRGLLVVLIAIARISDFDLEKCRSMPLSLNVFSNLDWTPKTLNSDIDLLQSFEMLSHLLLGHAFSQDYVKNAVLVSGWGWSIFFNSVDAVDPADSSMNTIRVKCGVPSRRGVRRARIMDGYSGTPMSLATATLISKDPDICFFPGVSSAKRGPALVGFHADAFTATQSFDWKSIDQHEKKHLLGFREMQEQCLQADLLSPCQHGLVDTDAIDWIDDQTSFFHMKPRISTTPYEPKKSTGESPCFESFWPQDLPSRAASTERVFIKESSTSDLRYADLLKNTTWYFHVSSSPAARWLQLHDMYTCSAEDDYQLVIRSSRTCLDCATHKFAIISKRGLMLL